MSKIGDHRFEVLLIDDGIRGHRQALRDDRDDGRVDLGPAVVCDGRVGNQLVCNDSLHVKRAKEDVIVLEVCYSSQMC